MRSGAHAIAIGSLVAALASGGTACRRAQHSSERAANKGDASADPAGAAPGAGADTERPADGATEVLFEGMGNTRHEITTRNPRAQKFFDQALVLAWGFNHAEAGRSFLEAARLDPACAMCYWGAAWVLGPNINAKMDAADAPRAWELVQKAVALADKVSEEERAYIAALAARYAEKPPVDRAPLDQAFTAGMRAVVVKFPDDLDARAILAEAIMDEHPWDYWDLKTRKPRRWTPEILGLLEGIMARKPGHVAANHLYIHAVEASPTPQMGESAADRLGTLVPGAGHLVHMPSHIYLRTGRYADGSAANEAAIRADQAYITQCRSGGIYPLAYHPHNWHFLWMTATFEGRSARAIEAAQHVHDKVPADKMHDHAWGVLQHYNALPLYAYARFGKWQEILNAPPPDASLDYPTAVWHYTRGLALVNTSRVAEAEKELAVLEGILSGDEQELTRTTLWDINSAYALMQIGRRLLAGEIAAKKGDTKTAIKLLEKAADMELSLNYDEPPDWYYPVRHSLGAVYLEAGRAKDAEKVYRTDLQWYPENGFALFGLEQALAAQGKSAEAAEVHARFVKTWARADHTLTSSRF